LYIEGDFVSVMNEQFGEDSRNRGCYLVSVGMFTDVSTWNA